MAKWSSQCFRSSCSLNLPWLFLCYLLHFKAWVLSCPVVSHLLFPSFLIFPDLYRVLEFLSSHLAPNCNRLQQTTLMILMSFAAALDHRDCCSNVHGYVAKAHLWQSRIKSLWFRTYTTYTGNIWKHRQTEFLDQTEPTGTYRVLRSQGSQGSQDMKVTWKAIRCTLLAAATCIAVSILRKIQHENRWNGGFLSHGGIPKSSMFEWIFKKNSHQL